MCLACEKCNLAKGTKDIADFLVAKPDVLKRILAQAKAPRHDAAAVNTTRRELNIRLEALGLPIECGSGGLAKYNRSTRELPKTHWLDAALPPNPLEGDGYPCRNFDDYGLGCIQAIEISWIELGGNQE